MKQNTFNESYTGLRDDVLKLVPKDAKTVLDVGCSTGVLGESIKRSLNSKVTGIELSPEMSKVAATKIDSVIVGSIEDEAILNKLGKSKFDVIILADVLEHLVDPWFVLNSLTKHLSPNGVFVISLPNIRHFNTFYNLLVKGYWPYRDRGIHDRTHLHQFTRKNIEEMLSKAGLVIDEVSANYRVIETPHYLNRYAKLLALPFIEEFIVYQYLIRAKKKR